MTTQKKAPAKQAPAKKPARHPGGRPRITWNDEQVAQFKTMCGMMCTEQEICAVMGVSKPTMNELVNRYLFEEVTGHKRGKDEEPIKFRDAFEVYSAQGTASLRRMQFKAAQAGDKTMLVWLGKQYLGQSDRMDYNVTEIPYVIDDIE